MAHRAVVAYGSITPTKNTPLPRVSSNGRLPERFWWKQRWVSSVATGASAAVCYASATTDVGGVSIYVVLDL